MKRKVLAVVMACVLMLGFGAAVYPPSLSVSAATEVSMECCDVVAPRSIAPQNEYHVNGGPSNRPPVHPGSQCCRFTACPFPCWALLLPLFSCNC